MGGFFKNIRQVLSLFSSARLQGRMSETASMDRIKRNAQEAKETIEALKSEVSDSGLQEIGNCAP